MTKNSTKKREIAVRRALIAGYFRRGIRKQMDIVRKLEDEHGLIHTQATVSRDLKVLYKEWQQSALVDIDAIKGLILDEIADVTAEAWRSWKLSQHPTETVIEEMSSRAGTSAKIRRETKGIKITELTKDGKPVNPTEQLGDPRFLAIVDKQIDKRIKIFGLNAPTKQEHSGDVSMSLIRVVGADPDKL